MMQRMRKIQTMKEINQEKTVSADLLQISAELENHRERLEGLGLLLDAQLSFMRENEPSGRTLEALRAIIADRIDKESQLMEELAGKIDEARILFSVTEIKTF